jgi:uncharacterized protein (TIGR00255 family)
MPVRSMTGFGIAEAHTPSGTYRVEIRGVNNRFMDLQLRQPRYFANLEQKTKKEISETIARGSISVFVSSDSENEVGKLTWDKDSVGNYVRIFREIKKANKLEGDVALADLLKFSDVIKTTTLTLDDKTLWKHFSPVLSSALAAYQTSRENEGKHIIIDLKKSIAEMLSILTKVEQQAPKRIADYTVELKKRIEKILGQVGREPDEQRLATEVALMADRLDISEECQRLRAHIDAFTKDFKSEEPVGKRMGFLLQEMNREANTIGSKSNDTVVSHLSVKLKEYIEKIREQIQNIE